MTDATFTAYGDPRPRGSTRARTFKDKKGETHVTVTDTNRGSLIPWLDTVRAAGSATGFWAERGVPVALTCRFFMPRPQSLPKRKPTPHVKRPDIDKLVRAVFDALAKHVYADDSQVQDVVAVKDYAAREPGETGDAHRPRVIVTIRRVGG